MSLDISLGRFAGAVAQGGDTEWLGPHARGVSAYAANRLFNRADALAEVYPTIVQLVGAEFFGALAREFARRTPSLSGDLNQYGAGLPEFVAGFEPARDLPYLPDMARLDWARHQAYYAADVAAFDASSLARVPAEQQGALPVRLHPAVVVVASRYPIVSILDAHEGGNWPDLDQGGETALVHRAARHVRTRLLAAPEAALLLAWRDGAGLAGGLAAALACDEAFDFSTALPSLIGDEVIAAIG